MSRGISVYFKQLSDTNNIYTYGYSGVSNKEYDKNDVLAFDGIIHIAYKALAEDDIATSIRSQNIWVEKECKYEWHESRVKDGDQSYGLFALKAVTKIIREYKSKGYMPLSGGYVS